MRNENQFNIEKVQIEKILITNVSIENPHGFLKVSNTTHKTEFTFHIEIASNIEKKRVKVTFSCNLESNHLEEAAKKINGIFEIEYLFHIENLEQITILENGVLTIDAEAGISLANIAYSTSRGIIYTRTLGTVLDAIIFKIPFSSTPFTYFIYKKYQFF